jgi:hypothetical protein
MPNSKFGPNQLDGTRIKKKVFCAYSKMGRVAGAQRRRMNELDAAWDLARGLKLQPNITSAEARQPIASDPLP